MRLKHTILVILLFTTHLLSFSSQKVYLIHGYGGLGVEMDKIKKAIKKENFITESYLYLSLVTDIDSVGRNLFRKIQTDNFDTVSFVTHSMGALVVRSLYENLDSTTKFPFIYRIVMIAPPNNGSPVADYFAQFNFLKFILGPNINNLTSSHNGAKKYPIPTCQVGLIAGSYGGKRGFNAFIKDDNDGVLIPQQTKLGVEQDIVFVKSWHVGLLFNKKVVQHTISFLKEGAFFPLK